MPTRRGGQRRLPFGRKPLKTYIRQVAETQDRKDLQRTEGKWFGFDVSTSLITANSAAFVYEYLPRPPEMRVTSTIKKAERDTTIYGMNSVIVLSAISKSADPNQDPCIGALAATILRHGDTPAALPNPMPLTTSAVPQQGQDPVAPWNVQPWRWWQPFVLDVAGENPKHTMATPFRLRKRRIMLHGRDIVSAGGSTLDQYVLLIGTGPKPQSENGITIRLRWFGRYRYIEKEL